MNEKERRGRSGRGGLMEGKEKEGQKSGREAGEWGSGVGRKKRWKKRRWMAKKKTWRGKGGGGRGEG